MFWVLEPLCYLAKLQESMGKKLTRSDIASAHTLNGDAPLNLMAVCIYRYLSRQYSAHKELIFFTSKDLDNLKRSKNLSF